MLKNADKVIIPYCENVTGNLPFSSNVKPMCIFDVFVPLRNDSCIAKLKNNEMKYRFLPLLVLVNSSRWTYPGTTNLKQRSGNLSLIGIARKLVRN